MSALGAVNSTMGQVEKISQNNSVVIINTAKNIEIENGINVTIIDNSNDSNVNVTIKENANVNYIIFDSKNTNRTFDVYSNLTMSQIMLETSEETLNVNLNSQLANADIKVLSIANKNNSYFLQNINHNEEQTTSNIVNVGVAMNGSYIKFEPIGKINKGKKNSKCAQLSRGIVMDDISKIEAKPILLIDEFDCFANHGASIGKMNDEDLFYLMSRGLNKTEAFMLILKGIIKPYIDSVPEDYKEKIELEIKNLIEK